MTLRALAVEGLEHLGIALHPVANAAAGSGIRDIATADAAVRILVVPTNEELEIARQAVDAIRSGR